ncbi:MAG TPA: porin family protein, partial [Patescibacteria group bacterium]|nr:porin family protein [Patescibacteria group bacterium]
MKIRNVLIAAIVITACIADVSTAGEISYGAKVGMTMANITQTPVEWEQDKSFKGGFTCGVFLNYAITDNFSLQPELLYTQKGVKDNLYDGLFTVDLTASFDYIELPVLAKYTFMPQKKFRPNIFGGPSVAFTMSSELEVSALLFS